MENDRIIEMARALGRAIQMSEGYIALENARRENDKDERLQDLIGQFNLAKMNLNNELSREGGPNSEKVAAYNNDVQLLYAEIVDHPGMTRYSEASAEMNSLMTFINAILTTAVTGGNPDTVTQPEECSGSCESCAGCS